MGLRPRSQGPIRLRIGPCGHVLDIHGFFYVLGDGVQGMAGLVQLAAKSWAWIFAVTVITVPRSDTRRRTHPLVQRACFA